MGIPTVTRTGFVATTMVWINHIETMADMSAAIQMGTEANTTRSRIRHTRTDFGME
jgi:hypothetical protein